MQLALISGSKLNELSNRAVLKTIRCLNLVLVVVFILYAGDVITGLPISNIIAGLVIIWGVARSDIFGGKAGDTDFISLAARKVVTLEWGLSILLLTSFILLLWGFRQDFYPAIKKICGRS